MLLRLPLVSDLYNAVVRFLRHDGLVMAGYLAYLTVLGLFPFLIILVALAGVFGNTTNGAQFIVMMLDTLPPDIQLVIEQPVSQIVATSQGGALTLGLAGAVWVASSAIGAASLAIDRAFETTKPPAFWLRQLHSIGLVIFGAVAMTLGFSVFVLGPLIFDEIINIMPMWADWSWLANSLRYGFSLTLLYLALVSLYFALRPKFQGRYVAVTRGALLTLVLWILIGAGFSIYLKNFANYNITYGSLAGAIATLVFFYLLNVAFLLGAEMNALVAKRRQNTADGVSAD
ncbi:YihY/virulence factor BrkB family protein [Govanella unica]|uniref:YihY/virulence factor BrkB family protein n=1 Tax=Govanella unica TaxID=2975056 RepID=A0A9X3TYH3_9PROT|nr:YihY/virulence factor BrkB family protein [Govania unica]MDA5194035.1 YihY/virulence factor BrkB family protein [Govania unica]